jgi:hypothetical protein
MTWNRFVAFGVLLAMSYVWIRWRGEEGLAGTAMGLVAFVAVLWLVLRLAGN